MMAQQRISLVTNYILEHFNQKTYRGDKTYIYNSLTESEPAIIAAGHKIDDVYQAYASARASFVFANLKNFGDISGDNEISRLYAKTHFLTNALIEYAICLDISWQVIWAFIQPASLEYLMHQKYKEMEKECSRDSVLAQLQCTISQHGNDFTRVQKIMDIMKTFDNDKDTLELRSVYNGIKHQGIIHFEGLGANFTEVSISINGKTPPMLHRKSYTVEEIEELLFAYHKKFGTYMNNLISEIIPAEYLNNKVGFVESINRVIEMNNVAK